MTGRAALDTRTRLVERLRAEVNGVEPIEPLRRLGGGFRSDAYGTASGFVVRVARTADGTRHHEREQSLLPALAPLLPVPIPVPRARLAPDEALPNGALVYRLLAGRALASHDVDALDVEALAPGLARFLSELHRSPVELARRASLPGPDDGELVALRERVLPGLARHLEPREHARVAKWWDARLDDPRLVVEGSCLCHGDLWFENLLVGDDGALAGVIDFEGARLGDPALDYAALLHLGEDLVRRVLALQRRNEPELEYRIGRYWEQRVFDGIDHAFRYDAGELPDALEKLRTGPILCPEKAPRRTDG